MCVCVCGKCSRTRSVFFCFLIFCVMHQHYEGCDEADREDQAQQRRPPDLEAAPWLLFPIVRTHETTDAVPSCVYKEDPHPRLDRQEEHAGARQELPGPRAETDEAATFLCLRHTPVACEARWDICAFRRGLGFRWVWAGIFSPLSLSWCYTELGQGRGAGFWVR